MRIEASRGCQLRGHYSHQPKRLKIISMYEPIYLESEPTSLDPDIFRLHQSIITDLGRSPGIVVEDGCAEFMFVKQGDVRLRVGGLGPMRVPRAYSAGKFTRPFKYEYPG